MNFRKKIILLIIILLFWVNSAIASQTPTTALHPKEMKWEFEGFFGRFDKQSIERGYQIYKEIC